MIDLEELERRIDAYAEKGIHVAPVVRELISELRELRSMRRADNEDIAQAYDFARNKGEALERAAVVAWLRATREASTLPKTCWEADAIERGEHRKGNT